MGMSLIADNAAARFRAKYLVSGWTQVTMTSPEQTAFQGQVTEQETNSHGYQTNPA